MKPETRLRRHAQLWESGTASTRRVAMGGLIFAILILLRVVEPYHQVETAGKQAMAALEVQEAGLLKQQAQLVIIERTLLDIEIELQQEPWNVEMDKLIAYFKELRSSGSGDLPVPKDKANETIDNIVELVENRVIEKLRAVMTAPETSERLADYPDRVQAALDQWKKDNYNTTEWYFTRESKDKTISGMSKVLSALKTDALTAVDQSKSSVPRKKAEIARKSAEIKRDIAEQTALIEDDLYEVLPGWAQNSVGLKSMIVFYPWILVAIAVGMVGNALVATRHFHSMADEEKWTAAERSDPLLSSPWTLTWRGVTGTTVTVINYFAVISVLGFCLGRAVDPPFPKVTAPTDGAASDGTTIADSSHALADAMSAVLPMQFAYGLLIAALAVVLVAPLMRRARET